MFLFLGMGYAITIAYNPYVGVKADMLVGAELTTDTILAAKFGRLGFVMFCISMCMIACSATLTVPTIKPVVSQQTDMWQMSTWKRCFIFCFNVCLGILLTWLLEFSYSGFFGANAVGLVLMLMFVEEFALHFVESVLDEALLLVPGKMAVFVSLMIVTL